MIKRILAAMVAFIILLSLFACAAEKPEETTGGETQDTTGAQESQEPIKWLTYEEYLALTPEQQQAYYKRFSSPEEYMVWFNAVAKAHSNSSTQIEGNEGHITQPTELETAPVPETTTPQHNEEQITPETTTPVPTEPEKEMPVLLTYEEYMALSPAVQQAYYESFPSMETYMQWFNNATKEYNQSNDNTQIEGESSQDTRPTTQPGELENTQDPTRPANETEPETTEPATKPPQQLDGYGEVGSRGD